MPNLNFVLPHWIYWALLILLPLFGAYMAQKERKKNQKPGVSMSIAYMLWFAGGFFGLHRFYVRRPLLALVYVILCVGIISFNKQENKARIFVSNAQNEVMISKYEIVDAEKKLKRGEPGATQEVAKAREKMVSHRKNLEVTNETMSFWDSMAGAFGLLILLFMLVDAYLLRSMVRKCAEDEANVELKEIINPRDLESDDPTVHIHSKYTDPLDKLSDFSGNYVAFWSLIAVFVYYYEVIARYVFNSPTNWAHESMFLMFGMQYLLSGAYALKEDAHVRVDVLYVYLPKKYKALVDVISSIFFYLFVGSLFVTGIIFAKDSISVWEVSFTEWAIQYWPIKLSLAVGAFGLLLQGISKLIKDILLLTGKKA